MNNGIYHKKYTRDDKFRNELATLEFISGTDLAPLTPRVLKVYDDCSVDLHLLQGNPESNPDSELMPQIGKLAKNIHSLGEWDTFGRLDEGMTVKTSFSTFPSFLEFKVEQWESTLTNQTDFVLSYINWIKTILKDSQKEFEDLLPVFCHGDLDLKNILVTNGRISGVIDWEDAGIFCLEWELRKLSRWFEEENELWRSFVNGYGSPLSKNHDTRLQVIKTFEAIDLIGHLGWCMNLGNNEEYKETINRMRRISRQG